jgi:hypothetical protein
MTAIYFCRIHSTTDASGISVACQKLRLCQIPVSQLYLFTTPKTLEKDWKLAFEFRCQSSEQIYIKPGEEYLERIPPEAEDFNVVHVPPFSGIGTEETRYDRAYQELLIGQGKPGDIIRNLLREVFEMDQDRSAWNNLCLRIPSGNPP